MGGTLPSTGMWQGEVFAISDCLVCICDGMYILSENILIYYILLEHHKCHNWSQVFACPRNDQFVVINTSINLPSNISDEFDT